MKKFNFNWNVNSPVAVSGRTIAYFKTNIVNLDKHFLITFLSPNVNSFLEDFYFLLSLYFHNSCEPRETLYGPSCLLLLGSHFFSPRVPPSRPASDPAPHTKH